MARRTERKALFGRRMKLAAEAIDRNTTAAMGELMGISHATIGRWWRGDYTPSLDEMERYADNPDRQDRGDRIAATIRHNRARGKHQVDRMSDIVIALAKRNWSEAKIARELGMDADEVLRLKQVGGLAELFADREFSRAWEPA